MSVTSVTVLAFEGVSLFHLTVPDLVFGSRIAPVDFPAFDVRYCAVTPGMVCTDAGLQVRVDQGLDQMAHADIIIVPGWMDPETRPPEVLIDVLQKANETGKLIVGLCQGAFVLGYAGLLNERKATTHWASSKAFARLFPRADFLPDVLYTDEGNIITSAGTVAAIDCCLHLVRLLHGADTANRKARMLVTPPHRHGGQAQYIERPIPQYPCQNRLPGVLEWAAGHLSEPLSVDKLAEIALMSRRSFTRHFREATGLSVIQWLNAQRVARAQQLLETTELSVEQVARECGFGTALSMRLQFGLQLKTSPSDYRRSFRKTEKGAAPTSVVGLTV